MQVKRKRVIVKEGDIFKVPISKNKHAYVQYYYRHVGRGIIVRVFDIITSRELMPEEIVKHKIMFPPIFVGLLPPIREGVWQKIGNIPITDFIMPKFKLAHRRPDGTFTPWHIIEGDKAILVGDNLSEKYKKLEMERGWSYHDVVKRIKNKGKIPYKAWE